MVKLSRTTLTFLSFEGLAGLAVGLVTAGLAGAVVLTLLVGEVAWVADLDAAFGASLRTGSACLALAGALLVAVLLD
jgi:hypothetical protein